jgi:arylsulfatase A-like enzyme
MWEVNQDQLQFHLGKVVMEKEDFEVLRALYDGSIHYLDQRIYEIYSILKNEDCLDDTMIIITADHGDNIGEHDLMGHIWCLYDTLIKIPLIIKYPSDYDVVGEDESLVQNLDIMPTIMDILKIQHEKVLSQIQGNSLFSNTIVNRNQNYAIAELLKPFSSSIIKYEEEFMRYNRGLICIRGIDKKYIWSTDGKHELYDLEKDPEETTNVIDIETPSLPELQNEVKSRLPQYNQMFLKINEKIRQPMEIQIDANIKQRLQELGYM